MTWEIVAIIVELVGSAAVVVALIYVGQQLRQSARSERAIAEMEASRLWSEFHARVAHSPDMNRIWDTAQANPADLTDEERQRFVWLVAEYVYLVEALFKQRARGFLSRDAWDSHADRVVGLLSNPIASEWWASGQSPFSPEFAEHINERRTGGVGETWEVETRRLRAIDGTASREIRDGAEEAPAPGS
ncbi:MAG: hypothetical protein R3195_14660 [Gemmatimonadota bacterium]|nr:hypothetical protein [Gemmatimonadota bacterium]